MALEVLSTWRQKFVQLHALFQPEAPGCFDSRKSEIIAKMKYGRLCLCHQRKHPLGNVGNQYSQPLKRKTEELCVRLWNFFRQKKKKKTTFGPFLAEGKKIMCACLPLFCFLISPCRWYVWFFFFFEHIFLISLLKKKKKKGKAFNNNFTSFL